MKYLLPETSFPDQSRLNRKSLGMAMMLSVASVPAANAALNSAQIVASAVSQACISWRVSGICYWLFCGLHGCTVRTSVKVTHFIPEAVVSTYNSQGGNPWREMSMVSQASGGLESSITGALSGVSAGGGNNELKTPGQRKTNLHFKYADAIGHPATSIIGGSIPGYSCRSAAMPFVPYFLSTLDSLAWRTGMPESLYPEALVPGQREIGNQAGANMWGNVYPRSGFVTQVDDDKAGTVVAQRVADIITRSGQPHVYQPLIGQQLREQIRLRTHLTVGIGIAPTKTLAKLAQYASKRWPATKGVVDLSCRQRQEKLMALVPVEEIWGIGRQLAKKLQLMGIDTALKLSRLSPAFARKQFSVVVERTVRELNGISCLGLEEFAAPKEQIICSRSFGENQRMRTACTRQFAHMRSVQLKSYGQSTSIAKGSVFLSVPAHLLKTRYFIRTRLLPN